MRTQESIEVPNHAAGLIIKHGKFGTLFTAFWRKAGLEPHVLAEPVDIVNFCQQQESS